MKSIFIASLLLCTACSEIGYKKPEEKKPVQLSEGEDFKVQLRGLDEPNRFSALVQYSGPNPGNWTVIRKSGSAKLTNFSFTNTKSNEGVSDSDLQSGETYIYMIGQTNGGEFEAARSQEIIVPHDFVVSGTLTLKEEDIKGLNKTFRIFFEKDSVLKTNGLPVDLEIEEIFSRGGKIQTFASNDSAETGHPGNPSGKVHLKVSRITGPITVEIRGQKGGMGFKGAAGPQGPVGAPNARIAASNYLDIGFELTGALWNGTCAPTYYRPEATHGLCEGLTYQECRWKIHPGVGGTGGTGGIGSQGGPGFIGGNAEDAEIEINSGLENMTITYEAGAGGNGGEGGDGGPGGSGGPGVGIKNNSPGMPCEESPQGKPGDTGPRGPTGPSGNSGAKDKLIINGVLQ